jgi:hypothetical protein
MINGGTCYKCGGTGKEEVSARTAKKREQDKNYIKQVQANKEKVQTLWCGSLDDELEACDYQIEGFSMATAPICPKCNEKQWENENKELRLAKGYHF